MKLRWSISNRTIALAWAAVIVTACASQFIQRSVIRSQGIVLERNAMRNLVLSAENTRDGISALNGGKAFDRKALIAEFLQASDFRATRFYNTIPIVAAWKTIQKVADSEGYVFRTPSLPSQSQEYPDSQGRAHPDGTRNRASGGILCRR